MRKIAGKRNYKYAGWSADGETWYDEGVDDEGDEHQRGGSSFGRMGTSPTDDDPLGIVSFNQKVEVVYRWLTPIFSSEVREMKVSDRDGYLQQLSSEIVRAVLAVHSTRSGHSG